MKKPFVISISGISGGGKTTVANSLKERLAHSIIISFDDYDNIRLNRDINEWSADGNNKNEWYVEPLTNDIKRMLKDSFDYIVVDYPFGYRNLSVGKYIDFAVFVDTPLDIALARRIIRDYTNRSADRNKIEVNLTTVENELRFYLEHSRPTYARMPETQKPFSDLVVNGTKTPDDIADEIMSYVKTRNHYDALINEIDDPQNYKVVDPAHDIEPLKSYMNKWDGEAFLEAMQLNLNKSVLEIGVGTGRLALRVCGKCGSFTGIDISPKTIERAKENLREFSNVHLICGNYLTHKFHSTFDVIYSSLTFMHIEDKQAAIQKTADLLTPGGRFVLSIDKNQQTEIDYGTRRIPVFPDRPEEVSELLTKAGFTIEQQFETEFAVIFTVVKAMSI